MSRKRYVSGGQSLFLSAVLGTLFFVAVPFSQAKSVSQESLSQKISRLKYPSFPQEAFKNPFRKLKEFALLPNHQWSLSSIGFLKAFSNPSKSAVSTVKSCPGQIVVAVVDTGIDYTHPGLVESLWINQKETGPWKPRPGDKTTCRDKSCNGIDDDGNGFIDDVSGWDFVHNTPLAYDTHGHGTHISGIVASQPNSSNQVVGVCPRVSVMALKYYDSSVMGYNNLSNTIKSIEYAVANGAHIINYSGGGSDSAAGEKRAIEKARKAGILFVAAAGNNGLNNDHVPYYPASYPLDNVISVASMDSNRMLLTSSNYGESTVDIAAPGLNVLSNLPQGRSGTMSGTSQATAFVTGAAALLASRLPPGSKFDYKQIKKWILQGATYNLRSREASAQISGGVLSIPGSLKLQQDELGPQSTPAIARKKLPPKLKAKTIR